MSKVHLVCRVMTLCVADPIWGVCRDSYTLDARHRQIHNVLVINSKSIYVFLGTNTKSVYVFLGIYLTYPFLAQERGVSWTA